MWMCTCRYFSRFFAFIEHKGFCSQKNKKTCKKKKKTWSLLLWNLHSEHTGYRAGSQLQISVTCCNRQRLKPCLFPSKSPYTWGSCPAVPSGTRQNNSTHSSEAISAAGSFPSASSCCSGSGWWPQHRSGWTQWLSCQGKLHTISWYWLSFVGGICPGHGEEGGEMPEWGNWHASRNLSRKPSMALIVACLGKKKPSLSMTRPLSHL